MVLPPGSILMADDTNLSSTDASTTQTMTGSRLRSGNPVRESLRVVIVGPEEVLETKPLANEIQNLLTNLGHTVETLLAARTEWGPSPREGTDSNIAHDADLVIVLGGDGSILRTARWMGYQQTPVLGVNLGRLGFLADFSPSEVEMAISELIAGRFLLVEHMMFETCVERKNKMVASDLGLNETSLLAGPPFSLFEVELHVDDELATIYRGDGLIISTPVGSTAYNMSAGGPIVRKSLEAFIFTPLNPHTLTQRTVIDTASRSYSLVIPSPHNGSSCVVDGRLLLPLQAGDKVRISRAEPKFCLIETNQHGYYSTLRDKLAWGGGIQNTSSGID